MKKRIALSLALLAGLVMGATTANAATIKATGAWQIDAALTSENDMTKHVDDNTFSIGQRMRTKFEFIANENLKGVLETQIGTNSWGNGLYGIGAGRTPSTNAQGALASGNGNVQLRKGYIDFNWPGTKVKFLAGYQSLALPSAFGGGSAILDDHVAGAAAVVPVTDNISLVGGYARPVDLNGFGATASVQRSGTAVDTAFLYSNMDFTGFKVQPFAAYSYAGRQTVTAIANGNTAVPIGVTTFSNAAGAAEATRAYWAGAAVTVTALDPFKIMADLNYGKANGKVGTTSTTRSGWLGDIAVDYTGLSMMTPELFFAYSTGEGKNDRNKSERMPVLSGENWAYGTFWMQGGDTLANSYTTPAQNMGFWALGLSLKDIKLIDKLSHTVSFIYFKGTNAKESAAWNATNYRNFLTEKDSLFEVDVNSKYQIYEELSLGLELGYINANYDKSLWSNAMGVRTSQLSKDAYKGTLMLQYNF